VSDVFLLYTLSVIKKVDLLIKTMYGFVPYAQMPSYPATIHLNSPVITKTEKKPTKTTVKELMKHFDISQQFWKLVNLMI
jgi:hypothetical protein